MENRLFSRDIAYVGLLVALLSVSGYISFPIPFTPIMITAQTIIINLIGLVLSPRKSVLTISVFLLLGAIGIPVFAGGSSGLGVLFGPSGGFFIGFLISVFLISFIRRKKNNMVLNLVLTIGIGMSTIYLIGTTWLSYYNGTSVIAMIPLAVIPFIPGDIIKAIIASIIALKINKLKR